jgi:hypothetical protein
VGGGGGGENGGGGGEGGERGAEKRMEVIKKHEYYLDFKIALEKGNNIKNGIALETEIQFFH